MTRSSLVTLALLLACAVLSPPPALAVPGGQDTPDKQADNAKKSDKKQKGKDDPAPPAPYTGPKKRLAVMNTDQEGNTAPDGEWYKMYKAHYGFKDANDVGLKLNSMLTSALQNTGRFVLVERQNFNDIRGEQDLAKEGQTTQQTGAQKGSVLGAQIMVRCAITEFSDDAVKEGGGGGVNIGGVHLGGGSARKKAKVVVDVKMFDVATSKVLFSQPASGYSDSKANAGGISGFGAGFAFGKSTNDPIEKATRDAITNAVNLIVAQMENIPWEGKVAFVGKDDDGKPLCVLNRGEADGLKVGDELVIVRPGQVIIDPDTGEKLGTSAGKVMGACRVVALEKNTANVEPLNGLEIGVGNIVRLK